VRGEVCLDRADLVIDGMTFARLDRGKTNGIAVFPSTTRRSSLSIGDSTIRPQRLRRMALVFFIVGDGCAERAPLHVVKSRC